MVEAMNSVAKLGVGLNAEERNLLSVGYKNMLGAKRASWRILSVIKSKEEATGDTQHAALAKEYLERVGDEFTTKCNEILLTIDDYLLPSSKTGEAAVFYHKMKGDYYRYSAEIKSDADREEAKSQSLKAYEDATAIAESDLLPTNPIRLGLALNFSVFYYEIMADTERACNMAKQAFEDAAAELDSLDQKSSLIMRLIMDNLTLWTLDPAEDEDMVEAMNSVAKLGVELNAEERNLLSVGYKNMLGAKRASWRILSVIKSKEEATGDTQHAALAKEYLERVGDELTTKCNEILLTIDDYLLPSSKTGEAAVFYHKMKGDYYRYSAEIKSDADREEAKSQSLKAYEDATAITESDLLPTNPIRLGLALNFSVFYYEIMADTERACNMAKQAFEDAAAELDSLDQKSSLIMRLIMDNLTLWTLDPAEDEDMVEAMNSVAKLGVELNAEERNLLSVGYKNMLGAKRASWRILSVIKSKEEATGDTQHAALAKEYLERVGDELTTKCNEILLTIDDYLLPSSKTGEAAVFYHKMKGDYYRYSAEIKSDADREEAKSQSLKAYEDATAIAESDLLPTNPIRLGLALNFSVFYYEIMADTERACNMAKQAFEDAAAELDSLDQKSSLIMRLIMDNLTLWTLDPAEDEEKKAHRGEVQVPNIFDLTNDLLDEVLGRLEIPDILRFGGVSKRLSQLVKEYLLKSRMRQKVFLPSSPFHSVSLRDSNVITAHEIKQVSDRPIHPHLSFPEILIVGSIDGTVLVVELCQSPQKLLLVNPLTKHHREIPHRPLRPHPQNLIEEDEIVNNYAYGIGWAGKPAGLIIVQLYRTFIENMQPCCEMYSLRDACWRKFAPLKGGVHIKQFAGTFLKESNSLYWLARKGKLHVILKLHLDLMLFTELAFPNVVKGVPEQILGRVHSKICALTRDYLGSDSLEVWALQEDESRINWSKLYTFSENEVYNSERSGFPKILTYTNDGSMFLLNTEDYETDSTEKHEVAKQFLTIYNLSENSLKELTSPTSLGYISRTQASVYTENTDFFMTGNTGESYAKKVSDHELKRACSLGKDIFKMIDGKCYEESTLSTTGDS